MDPGLQYIFLPIGMAILGSCGTIAGYYINKGLNAGKPESKTGANIHTCRFTGNLEQAVADADSKINDIKEEVHGRVLTSFTEVFQRQQKIESIVFDLLQSINALRQEIHSLQTDRRVNDVAIDHPERRAGHRCILFVDDMAEYMTPIIMSLETMGYQVTTATNYVDGEALLRSRSFEFAIVDAALTRGEVTVSFDGRQLAQWASEQFPDTKVILFTGHDLQSIPPRVRCVKKDGTMSKLIKTIQEWK